MNSPFLLIAAVFLAGYLVGSVPFGLLLTRLAGGGDIRAIGSGNIGATNVLRTGRKGLAAATLLLDAGKGALAVVLADWWFADDFGFATLAGLGAMVGHCFPLWLGFKGGKGVATMLGISFALDWRIGAAAAATWLVMTLLTRISSVGGMSAALAAPVSALVLLRIPRTDIGNFTVGLDLFFAMIGLSIMAAIVLWRHRANIARLRAGTEPRIGQKG
ncbi:glycerol-3-phosphate 1-O-acyltransferase PlsY [Novosphingobium sp.]|uniref:glycerol-3-phosphate 1-O-acyltransferase PlsY n=1 Tax=Novosphingobium sp. TaxID=1874826 RepID=UPI002632E6ED|nr:glycerol-3-phosphate 1-O-acyltransferase PlsY [Novosphingobium sp.]